MKRGTLYLLQRLFFSLITEQREEERERKALLLSSFAPALLVEPFPTEGEREKAAEPRPLLLLLSRELGIGQEQGSFLPPFL